jgi:hypothetical protein
VIQQQLGVVLVSVLPSSTLQTGSDQQYSSSSTTPAVPHHVLMLLILLQVIFLPVCPWRTDPEAGPGWKKAVAGHVSIAA